MRTVLTVSPVLRSGGGRRTADGHLRRASRARHHVTPYRFLLEGGRAALVTQLGVVAHDVPDATDFRWSPTRPRGVAAGCVIYQIFPDRFARSAAADRRPLPDWAIRCDWDTLSSVAARDPVPVLRRRPDTDAERLDHVAALGVNTVYLTPIFPARSNHGYDAAAFDHVDPAGEMRR